VNEDVQQEQQNPTVGVYNRANDTMVDITYACTFNHDTKKIDLPKNLPGGSEVYVRDPGSEEWNHLLTTAVELSAPRVKRHRGNLLSNAIGAALGLPVSEGFRK
jgi:hypothetical protein